MKNFDQLSHFKKFSLPQSFTINLEDLEEKYIELQKENHPDNSSNETQAQINSILLNESYKILKNPIKRAIYLLKLENIKIEDERNTVKPDLITLQEILELREEVDANLRDAGKISALKKQIKEQIKTKISNLENIFAAKNFDEAAQVTMAAKYLQKIIDDLKKS